MSDQELNGIPGLVSITTEEDTETGGMRVIFDVDDQQVEQFFSALGLQDVAADQLPAALQEFVTRALEDALAQRAAQELNESEEAHVT